MDKLNTLKIYRVFYLKILGYSILNFGKFISHTLYKKCTNYHLKCVPGIKISSVRIKSIDNYDLLNGPSEIQYYKLRCNAALAFQKVDIKIMLFLLSQIVKKNIQCITLKTPWFYFNFIITHPICIKLFLHQRFLTNLQLCYRTFPKRRIFWELY